MGRPHGSLNRKSKPKLNPDYIKMEYQPITPEFVAAMDVKYQGAVSFYTNVILEYIENMYRFYGEPVAQKTFGNRRTNFRHYEINFTAYLDYLHEQKKLVQILAPSGRLLYFPAKVLQTMNQEELLGTALVTDENLERKKREAIRYAALERADKARMAALRKAEDRAKARAERNLSAGTGDGSHALKVLLTPDPERTDG